MKRSAPIALLALCAGTLLFGNIWSGTMQPVTSSTPHEPAQPEHGISADGTDRPSVSIYTPDIHAGVIGTAVAGEADDAYDNVFNLSLPEQPSDNDVVWLCYELNGVVDHDAVPRSINDQLTLGGLLARPS